MRSSSLPALGTAERQAWVADLADQGVLTGEELNNVIDVLTDVDKNARDSAEGIAYQADQLDKVIPKAAKTAEVLRDLAIAGDPTAGLQEQRDALQRLCRLNDVLHWRVAEDGSLALVSETWPDVTEHVDTYLPTQSHERCAAWWPKSGYISPGHSIEVYGTDRHLLRVEYDWQDEDVTVKGWY